MSTRHKILVREDEPQKQPGQKQREEWGRGSHRKEGKNSHSWTWAKGLDGHFSEKEKRVTSKHNIPHEQNTNQNQLRYHLTSIRMTTSKRKEDSEGKII